MGVVPINSVGGFSTGLTMTGVIDSLGNITGVGATFSGLIRANAGISAAGATFSGDIAVNGGDITTTSTSATLFNANATTLDIANTQSSGLTLNIANATSFGGNKIINIGRNNSGGAITTLIVGQNSNDKISLLGGVTIGVSPGSQTNIVGGSLIVNPESTFNFLARFTAGLSASGITVGGSIVLQNQEFIRNTTDGRIDFMPGPVSGTTYGLYMDFTTWGVGANGVQFGTITSSTGALDAAAILYGSPLVLANGKQFSFGSSQRYSLSHQSSTNSTLQLGVPSGVANESAAVSIMDYAWLGNANRIPATAHTNPNLYIYRAGNANANDFVRMEHDGTVGRIVSGGTSGINLEPGSGRLNVIGGISASGGFTFGSPSGTTFMVFSPKTSCDNGGLWIRDGNLQLGGSAIGSGAFSYSPCGEQFTVYGYSTFNNSYNYQAGRAPLRLNGAPTQSVPILAAYKQTSDGTQLTNTFTTTNMVAGIDQNGALFSSVGISAAGGITFTNNVQANGYILSSNARSWFL